MSKLLFVLQGHPCSGYLNGRRNVHFADFAPSVPAAWRRYFSALRSPFPCACCRLLLSFFFSFLFSSGTFWAISSAFVKAAQVRPVFPFALIVANFPTFSRRATFLCSFAATSTPRFDLPVPRGFRLCAPFFGLSVLLGMSYRWNLSSSEVHRHPCCSSDIHREKSALLHMSSSGNPSQPNGAPAEFFQIGPGRHRDHAASHQKGELLHTL